MQQQRDTHGNERNFSARGRSKEEAWALNPKFSNLNNRMKVLFFSLILPVARNPATKFYSAFQLIG
jgi:hypothetical protein